MKIIWKSFVGAVLLVVVSVGCGTETSNPRADSKDGSSASKLFNLVDHTRHGITFRNDVIEDLTTNYMVYDGVYQGAGVAVGDLNNDGLDDIFFCGNQVPDQLYVNNGNLNFTEVSSKAGILDDGNWSTGITIIDINNDGFNDIYVCRFLWDQPDRRKNLLYINQGNLTFIESADKYGIADPGYSIQSSFLDFDKDGDMDLYVVNQPPNKKAFKRLLKGKMDYRFTDRLFRNDGNTFTDITQEAGVKNYAYGLSATVGDLDKDGWLDIYVACDYEEPDLLYMNNGDGTFTNKAHESLRHMSNFSMGADIADINNDGWLDIYTADMVAEDNKRLKTNMSGMNPKKFWALAEAGYHYQYMFNTLQLNNGNGRFSEIAQLSQVHATDWSWSPLIADLDNDGNKDIYVTNGQKRDVRNNDYNVNRKKLVEQTIADAKANGMKDEAFNPLDLLNLAPSVKLKNYAYRNNGDLSFSKAMDDWGLTEPSWSNGSALSDLDNDGDLDILVNNHDDQVFIYENQASILESGNYIRFDLKATDPIAYGTEITIVAHGKTQFAHLNPSRGYLSQSERMIHFGLGQASTVESMEVKWPNGTIQKLTDLEVNQTIDVSPENASGSYVKKEFTPLFTPSGKVNLPQHSEIEFDDFEREILLPHKMSTLGPYLSVSDLNGDGVDDYYIGGASGQPGSLMISEGGEYVSIAQSLLKKDQINEDMGSAFFDADNDGDLDLYVTSGGNEFPNGSINYQDRLYLNNGNNSWTKSPNLPKYQVSNSCVTPFDLDNDGDQDLFVGGRQSPGKWPFPVDSKILRNEESKFLDVTSEVAPFLSKLGMVTDAESADLNGDGKSDLILAGEWLAPRILLNNNGKLEESTSGLDHAIGWWNTIEVLDIDNDGDLDIMAGNLGLNIKYKANPESPFSVFCDDFDENGSYDIVLSYYEKGSCFPVRGRQCSSEQMPFIKKKFPTYDQFSVATMSDIHGDNLKKALQYHATEFRSGSWINDGSGQFRFSPFPNEAQIFPVQGIVPLDINSDGFQDLILAGNYYNREVETTRSDAGIGCVLLGNGDGSFRAMPATEHGLSLYNDVRDIKLLKSNGSFKLIAANNNDKVQIYSLQMSNP